MSVQLPFFPLRKEDLDDNSLFRLNYLLGVLAEEVARVQGASGTTRFRGVVEAKSFRVTGEPGEDDQSVLTMGKAEELFGPEALLNAWSNRRWRNRPVRRGPQEVFKVLPMPDVAASQEAVIYDDGKYAFKGRLDFPVTHPDYKNLAGIEVNFFGPLDANGNETPETGPHIMGLVAAPDASQGGVVDWVSDFWDTPDSPRYFRILYTKISVRGEREKNNPESSALLRVDPFEDTTPVPDVQQFRAGTRNPDGTWSTQMYWDDATQRLVIDWEVTAPANVDNWLGVALWIRTASGSYHQASGVITITHFTETPAGMRYFDRHFVEPDSIPAIPETWRFIAVSYNRGGRPKRDAQGNPTGPSVDLQTLPAQNDVVSGFSVQVLYETSEGGDQLFRLSASWSIPPNPRFKGVRLVADWPGFPEEIIFAVELVPSTGITTDAWPVPHAAVTATVYAQTIYGDDTVKNKFLCPSQQIHVQRQTGPPGEEYAEMIPAASLSASVVYTYDESGGQRYAFNISWSHPSGSVRFRGVRLVARRVGGGIPDIVLAMETVPSTSIRTDSWPVPESQESWEIYAVSFDAANRANSITASTPKVVVTVAPQTPGASELFAEPVTNFTASVFYSYDESGGQRYGFQMSWNLPSNPVRYRGVKLIARRVGGGVPDIILAMETWPSTSIRTDSWPVPESQESWTIYAASFDGSNRANPITAQTPSATVTVTPSATGNINAGRINPATLDPSLAVSLGQLKVAAQGIGSTHLADLAVTAAKLADAAVGSSKLMDGAVVSAKIANAAVGAAAIAAAAVGSAHIGSGVIQTAHIGDAQITNAKISSVSVSKLTAGTAVFTGDVEFQNTGSIKLFNGGNVAINPGTLHGTSATFLSAGMGWEVTPGFFPQIRHYGAPGKIICHRLEATDTDATVVCFRIDVKSYLNLPTVADTGVAWNPVAKIAVYSSVNGLFVGWIPIMA